MTVKASGNRSLVQQAALRRSTMAWIAVAGEDVVLRRPRAAEDDGAGGRRPVGGAPTNKQAVRRVVGGRRAGRNSEEIVAFTDEGRIGELNVVLIGPPGDDIKVGDYFERSGNTCKVIAVDEASLDYQTKAEIEVVT